MENTYHQILEIKVNSTTEEIKRAYFKVIKKYPVDQYPEKFKAIRIAYETLRDSQSRREYETKLLHGDLIEQIQNKAMEAYSNSDFEEAKRLFKEVLTIIPVLTEIRNYYALSFLYTEEYNQALRHFKVVAQEEPENLTYQLNLGKALEKCGKDDEAIKLYKTNYIMFPTDMNNLFALVDLYIKHEENDKAIKTLDRAISSQEKAGNFHAFYYVIKRIKVSVICRNEIEILKSIGLCKELFNKHEVDRETIMADLTELSFELYDLKLYKFAIPIMEFVKHRQAKVDEKINLLIEETISRANVYEEFEILEGDDKVNKWVKNVYILYLHSDDFTEEEFDEYCDIAFENLRDSSFYDPEETLKSIKRVLIKYPGLYAERENVLTDFMNTCKHSLQCRAEVEQLKYDGNICAPVKRIVAFYLTYFDTNDEKEEMFSSIKNDFVNETDYMLKRSVDSLKAHYPALYQLNEKFFKDLQ